MAIKNHLFLKLQIALGAIAVLVLGFGGVTLYADRVESEISSVTFNTMKKQAIIERVDGLVYAVVMESRGLYMAETPQRIALFGDGLLKQLDRLQVAADEWRALVEAADREEFALAERQIKAFTELRTQLVTAARASGASAARALGDNDANRATRTALNRALDQLATRYRQRLDEMSLRNAAIKSTLALSTAAFLGLVFLTALGIFFWSRQRIAAPFDHLSQDLDSVSAGNLTGIIRHTEREDEVGAIAKTIRAFRDRLVEDRERLSREGHESALKAERARRLEAAIVAFETAASSRVAALSGTSKELHMAASSLSTGAEETARQADIVSEASDEMNANIDTLSQVGGQLVGAIGEIAEGMGRASEVSERAYSLSTSMATKFTDLEQAVAAIGHVVELINQIAAQTNLLALNATIEAARAGDAGRGFAIVAQEVKLLAAQTTQATAEIASNVTRVQSVTGDSISAVATIGATIENMRAIAMEVSNAVEAQRSATQEIAENVRSAADGTQSVTDNIAGVAQAAQETGVASMQVLASAGKLSEESNGIQGEVERFLSAIRAA